jgi:fructose-1,6-bisphosphatase/inositol monophosphatase family enzyme
VAPAAAIRAWHYARDPERSMLAGNQAKFNAHFNFRCAAHEYRLVASGNAHFLAYINLMPWDHAPGVLIHAEAGGHSAYLDGEPYRPSRMDGGLLVAPDKASWQEIRRTLWSA